METRPWRKHSCKRSFVKWKRVNRLSTRRSLTAKEESAIRLSSSMLLPRLPMTGISPSEDLLRLMACRPGWSTPLSMPLSTKIFTFKKSPPDVSPSYWTRRWKTRGWGSVRPSCRCSSTTPWQCWTKSPPWMGPGCLSTLPRQNNRESSGLRRVSLDRSRPRSMRPGPNRWSCLLWFQGPNLHEQRAQGLFGHQVNTNYIKNGGPGQVLEGIQAEEVGDGDRGLVVPLRQSACSHHHHGEGLDGGQAVKDDRAPALLSRPCPGHLFPLPKGEEGAGRPHPHQGDLQEGVGVGPPKLWR